MGCGERGGRPVPAHKAGNGSLPAEAVLVEISFRARCPRSRVQHPSSSPRKGLRQGVRDPSLPWVHWWEPPGFLRQGPQARLRAIFFTPTGVPAVCATQLLIVLAGGFKLISALRLQTCSVLSISNLDVSNTSILDGHTLDIHTGKPKRFAFPCRKHPLLSVGFISSGRKMSSSKSLSLFSRRSEGAHLPKTVIQLSLDLGWELAVPWQPHKAVSVGHKYHPLQQSASGTWVAGQGESGSLERMEQHEIISAAYSCWKTAGEIIAPFQCQWPGVTCFAANARL